MARKRSWRKRSVSEVSRSTNSESRCQRSRSPRLDGLVDEDLLEQVDVEARADDRGVAQEQPVGRVEPVDARGEQRLDRLRQGVRAGARRATRRRARGRRAGCRPRARSASRAGAPRARGRRPRPAPARRPARPAAGRARAACRARRARTARPPGAASRRRATAAASGRRARWRSRKRRRVVDPVHVLDDDQRRHQQHPRHELGDDLVQLVAAEGGVDLVRLRRRRHLGAERDGQQRQPRARGRASRSG